MSLSRGVVLGTDSLVVEAAEEQLSETSSAVGAVLAGYFAATGAYAGVLLGSLGIVVAGLGSGVRVFDGRVRQPGLGTKRPRGFQPGEDVPLAAYLAAPTSLSAATLALAHDGRGTMSPLLRRAMRQAARVGSERREVLLGAVKSSGAAAFSDATFARELLLAGGMPEQGLLTPADLAPVNDAGGEAARLEGTTDWVTVPWSCEPRALLGSSLIALCVTDPRGTWAAAVFERVHDGIAIDGLDLQAPKRAEPVRRGVERVTPGSRLAGPAGIAFRLESGHPVELLVSHEATQLTASSLASASLHLKAGPGGRVTARRQ